MLRLHHYPGGRKPHLACHLPHISDSESTGHAILPFLRTEVVLAQRTLALLTPQLCLMTWHWEPSQLFIDGCLAFITDRQTDAARVVVLKHAADSRGGREASVKTQIVRSHPQLSLWVLQGSYLPRCCYCSRDQALKITVRKKHPAGGDEGITRSSSSFSQAVSLWAKCGRLLSTARVHVIFLHSEWLGGGNTPGIGIIVLLPHQAKVEGVYLCS